LKVPTGRLSKRRGNPFIRGIVGRVDPKQKGLGELPEKKQRRGWGCISLDRGKLPALRPQKTMRLTEE